MTSCLGAGLAPARRALRAGRSGLAPNHFETVDLETFVGEIAGVDGQALPKAFAAFDCRNNRAAELGLLQDGFIAAVEARGGAPRRRARRRLHGHQHRRHPADRARLSPPRSGRLPAARLRLPAHAQHVLDRRIRPHAPGAQGPCAAISTACSSSAKAFASAARLIEAGLIDAAVVGGVDTLCLTTLYGFNSLQLLSADPAGPTTLARDGISIGEAAAFALLDRGGEGAIHLLGAGESCDAYHMSSPHPEGLGARLRWRRALRLGGPAPPGRSIT